MSINTTLSVSNGRLNREGEESQVMGKSRVAEACSFVSPTAPLPDALQLFRKLMGTIKDHKLAHHTEADGGVSDDDSQESVRGLRSTGRTPCRTLLEHLKGVLPSLVEQFLDPRHGDTVRVQYMCLLLNVLIDGGQCPHTVKIFGNGVAKGVVPHIYRLITLFSRPAFSTIFSVVIETITSLLSLMMSTNLTSTFVFLSDAVQLLHDCHFLAAHVGSMVIGGEKWTNGRIVAFEQTADLVAKQFKAGLSKHPEPLVIDIREDLSNTKCSQTISLRNSLTQVLVAFMPHIKQFVDSQKSLELFWEITSQTLADPHCIMTPKGLRFTALRSLRMMLRNDGLEPSVRVQSIPKRLMYLLRITSDSEKGSELLPRQQRSAHVNNSMDSSGTATTLTSCSASDGSVEEHDDAASIVNDLPMSFRTELFDDLLSDCIRLACGLVDSTCHQIDMGHGHADKVVISRLMNFIAPEGILEINILQKNIRFTKSMQLQNTLCDVVHLLQQYLSATQSPRRLWMKHALVPLFPYHVCSRRALQWTSHRIVMAILSTSSVKEIKFRPFVSNEVLQYVSDAFDAIYGTSAVSGSSQEAQCMPSSPSESVAFASQSDKIGQEREPKRRRIANLTTPSTGMTKQPQDEEKDMNARNFLKEQCERMCEVCSAQAPESALQSLTLTEIDELASFLVLLVWGNYDLPNLRSFAFETKGVVLATVLRMIHQIDTDWKGCFDTNSTEQGIDAASVGTWYLDSNAMVESDITMECTLRCASKRELVILKLLWLVAEAFRSPRMNDALTNETAILCFSFVQSVLENTENKCHTARLIAAKCAVNMLVMTSATVQRCEDEGGSPSILAIAFVGVPCPAQRLLDTLIAHFLNAGREQHRSLTDEETLVTFGSAGSTHVLFRALVTCAKLLHVRRNSAGEHWTALGMMTSLWDALFSVSPSADNGPPISALSVRYAMRAFVNAVQTCVKHCPRVLKTYKPYLQAYIHSSRSENRSVREAFAMTCAFLFDTNNIAGDGPKSLQVLTTLYDKGNPRDNMHAFLSIFNVLDSHSVPLATRKTLLVALGSLGSICARDLVNTDLFEGPKSNFDGDGGTVVVALEWVLVYLLDTWCTTNYLAIRLECCHQVHSIARSAGRTAAGPLTVLQLLQAFLPSVSKIVISKLLRPDNESDAIRFHLFTNVFLEKLERGQIEELLLLPSIQYVVPVLVTSHDKIGLTCLAKLWPQKHLDVRGGRGNTRLTGHGVNYNVIITDLLIEYSCPIVVEILSSSVEVMAHWKFVLTQIQCDGGLTVNDYIDSSFYEIVKDLVWRLGDPSGESSAIHALKTMSTVLAKGSSVRIQKTKGLDPFDALLRQYFLYILNTIQNRMKGSERTVTRRRALRVLHTVLMLLVKTTKTNEGKTRSDMAKQKTVLMPRVKQEADKFDTISNLPPEEDVGCETLGQYVPAILVTLKLAIEDKDVQDIASKVWKYFVSQLTNETALANLETIVVNLLPCLECGVDDARRDVVDTLKELIVKRRYYNLDGVLSTLPFSPVLLEADEDIKRVLLLVKQGPGEHVGNSVDRRLIDIIDLLDHDSPAVRLTALREIKRIMDEDILRLHEWLIPDTSDGELSGIAMTLLTALFRVTQKSSDEETHLACAECLGRIGAIDPARLRSRGSLIVAQEDNHAHVEIKTITCQCDFAVLVITNCLVPAMRAAQTSTVVDCVAYAIQEALKLIADDLKLQRVSRRKSRDFPDALAACFLGGRNGQQIVEVIRPYWSTTLKIKINEDLHDDHGPFYPRADSFDEWLGVWTRYLIQQSKGPLSQVFKICRTAIMKKTLNTTSITKHTALYLLPHLIFDVLSYGSVQSVASLKAEILLVAKPSNANFNNDCSLTSQVMLNKRVLSAQEIFALIDALTLWINDQEDMRYQIKRATRRKLTLRFFSLAPEKGVVQGKELLASVSNKELSALALDCNAYAQALLYYERHLRSTRDPEGRGIAVGANSLDIDDVSNVYMPQFHLDEISFVRKIYSKIDEPDGMRGLMSLRAKLLLTGTHTTQPTKDLQERVMDHEYGQEWSEALTCYEQVLKQIPARAFSGGQVSDASRDGEDSGRSRCHSMAPANTNTRWSTLVASMNVGILKCLLNVGHYETLLHQSMGVMNADATLIKDLAPFSIEAAWRLGKWDMLETLLVESRPLLSGDYSYQVGSAFFAMQKRDHVEFERALATARVSLMGSLAAASMESYERAYPMLLRLHGLYEMEQGFAMVTRDTSAPLSGSSAVHLSQGGTNQHSHRIPSKLDLIKHWEWDERLESTRPSVGLQEPLFALRRVTYQMNRPSLSIREGEEWIKLAKVSSASGHVRGTSIALMHAEALNIPSARIERAKLLHQQGQLHNALELLNPGESVVKSLLKRSKSHANDAKRTDVSERMLMIATWTHEAGLEAGDTMRERFKQITDLTPESTDGWFHLGKYIDFLLENELKSARAAQSSSSVGPGHRSSPARMDSVQLYESYGQFILYYFGKSLRRSCDHIYEVLPRVLSLWFEFGGYFHEALEALPTPAVSRSSRSARQVSAAGGCNGPQSGEQNQIESALARCSKLVREMGLLEYQWMTVFPQLASRLGHKNDTVRSTLVRIVTQLVGHFPEQLLWPMVGISNMSVTESNKARAKWAGKVLKSASQSRPKVHRMVVETERCCNSLIALAKKTYNEDEEEVFSDFGRDISSAGLLVPTQAQLTVSLPRRQADSTAVSSSSRATGHSQAAETRQKHHGFSTSPVTIKHFIREVEVMSSKEAPKAILIRGSDGLDYKFLCKQEKKGDLRKDSRMMETFTLANRLLQRDPEGRRRQLRVRTYAVTCLNHKIGLLEWVPNTVKFRKIMDNTYKKLKFPVPFLVTKALMKTMEDIQSIKHIPTKLKEYRKQLLQVYPPRMHRWFEDKFHVPTRWFEARLQFSRSCAVWSMLGHIVGLGDRHAENILLDTRTGECVHVDFDCIFDKGLLSLARPEVVPFRLTPQFVDGMGITGYDGVYRGSCETTMRVLRENRGMVLSVLEGFLHDPVVDWGNHRGNQYALEVVERTKKRIEGVYNYRKTRGAQRATDAIPLSIEGQVQKLIVEATKGENLVEMYGGWMPFA